MGITFFVIIGIIIQAVDNFVDILYAKLPVLRAFCVIRAFGNTVDETRNPCDIKKGESFIRQAAEAGNPMTQYNLGAMYLDSTLDLHDKEKARFWLTKAANQGIANAQTLISRYLDA